jgi:hypothetical protein
MVWRRVGRECTSIRDADRYKAFCNSGTSSANRLLKNQVWGPTGDHRMLGTPNLFRRGDWFITVLTIQNTLRHLRRSEGLAENHRHINGLASDLLYH